MFHYTAFGLKIRSAFPIQMLRECAPCDADVEILVDDSACDANGLPPDIDYLNESGRISFRVPKVGTFSIRDGKTIHVCIEPDVPAGLISVYLLGSCMGAALHQRGLLPLHGSCVCRDGNALLITGDSGAGKSTLAREFIRNGWRIITDDVAAVFLRDGKACVQPSYPSQKLWLDAVDRYGFSRETLLPLYQENRREKYSVDVSANFSREVQRLKGIILLEKSNSCGIEPVSGITIVDQLMQNTYRSYMILPEDRQKWFNTCVQLSMKIGMLFAYRSTEENSAPELYSRIINWMEEKLP